MSPAHCQQQAMLRVSNWCCLSTYNVQKRLWCVLRYFIFFLFKHLQKGVLSHQQFKTPNLLWNCAILMKRRTHLGRGNFVVVFIEVELIYNIALISGIQQHDSVIYIYIYIFVCIYTHSFLYFFPLWFILGYWIWFLVLYSRNLLLIYI